MKVNQVTEIIIGAAIEVHRALGPGLLESAYEECMCRELTLRQMPFERQHPLSVDYKGLHLDGGYRLDLLVANMVVMEIKAVEKLLPIHEAQLLTYLKLGGWKVGLLINFNVPVLKQGIRRRVLGLEEEQKGVDASSVIDKDHRSPSWPAGQGDAKSTEFF
jgi:GxxExxY protein